MKTIHKYQLQFIDTQTIDVPNYFRILKIDTQHGAPFIWAVLDDDLEKNIKLPLHIIATGNEVHEKCSNYIETFQLHGSEFHVFTDKDFECGYINEIH